MAEQFALDRLEDTDSHKPEKERKHQREPKEHKEHKEHKEYKDTKVNTSYKLKKLHEC